jgi:hypothetical protein
MTQMPVKSRGLNAACPLDGIGADKAAASAVPQMMA